MQRRHFLSKCFGSTYTLSSYFLLPTCTPCPRTSCSHSYTLSSYFLFPTRTPYPRTSCFPLLRSFHSSSCTITKFGKKNYITKLKVPSTMMPLPMSRNLQLHRNPLHALVRLQTLHVNLISKCPMLHTMASSSCRPL
jgi:hypothetical protein